MNDSILSPKRIYSYEMKVSQNMFIKEEKIPSKCIVRTRRQKLNI